MEHCGVQLTDDYHDILTAVLIIAACDNPAQNLSEVLIQVFEAAGNTIFILLICVRL